MDPNFLGHPSTQPFLWIFLLVVKFSSAGPTNFKIPTSPESSEGLKFEPQKTTKKQG